MNTITNDWETHTWTLKVADVEYDVKCYVYLTLKEVPDSYHWPARDTYVADFNLETWDCLPEPLNVEHEREIEKQLLQLLEEEYAQG